MFSIFLSRGVTRQSKLQQAKPMHQRKDSLSVLQFAWLRKKDHKRHLLERRKAVLPMAVDRENAGERRKVNRRGTTKSV